MSMNEARMTAILAAYGAEPVRWPAAERESALAWLAAHGAGAAHVEARALDAALQLDGRAAPASDALTARVLQAIPGAGATVLPFAAAAGARSWNAGAIAALAACAVMGVVIGFNASGFSDDTTADADAAFGAALGVIVDRGDPESDG